MKTTDREALRELLDLDLDGQLGAAERSRLQEHLAADAELAAEHRRLLALHSGLKEARVPVRPGFKAQVMAALPLPAWLPQPSFVWTLPLAMTTVLAITAAWFLSGSALGEGALVGTGLAVVDFLVATSMAGAGLLAASWSGLGLFLEELVARTGLSLLALAVPVVLLNLLFFSLLRRRRAPAAANAPDA
jgi:anti-sigma factor RsiW